MKRASRARWIACWLAWSPLVGLAATPSQGVEQEVRRGFFAETNIGVFFTLGGADAYSNAQSYLQLGMGYDLSDRLELGAHFGMGANAFNCFVPREEGRCPTSDNFTVTFFNGTLAYLQRVADRLYLTPKVAVGYTLLEPAPVRAATGEAVTRGLNVGAGLGIEYVTAMDHFSVGAELLARYVPVAGLSAITLFPRIKYTF